MKLDTAGPPPTDRELDRSLYGEAAFRVLIREFMTAEEVLRLPLTILERGPNEMRGIYIDVGGQGVMFSAGQARDIVRAIDAGEPPPSLRARSDLLRWFLLRVAAIAEPN